MQNDNEQEQQFKLAWFTIHHAFPNLCETRKEGLV